MAEENKPKPGVLFYGVFNGHAYELRPEGLHFYGNATEQDETAIKARIMRIFSDAMHEEHSKFDPSVSSHSALYKLLGE